MIKHIILSLATLALLAACDGGYKRPDAYAKTQPHIYPVYAGVTLPCNIAPTNFRIEQTGDAYQVVVTSGGKEYIRSVSDDADVVMSEDSWHEMLNTNKGGKITITIGVKREGKWTEYRPITNMISRDTIDSYLAYRLIYPGYELWNEMGIYQRNLTNLMRPLYSITVHSVRSASTATRFARTRQATSWYMCEARMAARSSVKAVPCAR